MNYAHIKRQYGLDREDVDKQLAAQDNRCVACQKLFLPHTRPPACDHDHRDGLVRGFLCRPCNYAIGERHDNQAWFARVAEYLLNPPTLDVIGEHFVPGSIGERQQRDREES